MTVLAFPDNTVLINFAYLHRMDLLERLVPSPAWCATVATERANSSREPDLEDMGEAHRIFGEPLYPETPAEHVLTQTYRMRLSRPGDGPHANLGEAETLAIVHSRGIRAVFFTDDAGPAGLISGDEVSVANVQVAGTWDLLRGAYRAGFVDGDTLWSYVAVLRSRGRHLPPGAAAHQRVDFGAWLA